MTQIAIVGCGVIGATIAYELSQVPGLTIQVFDRQPPATAATGAALGVLMGFISQKTKGRAWNLRLRSMERYETLIPELEAQTGQPIPVNRQGIVLLCDQETDLDRWHRLIEIRRSQGWQLKFWDVATLQQHCPQVSSAATGAIYSPHDRQIDPVALTRALVTAAEQAGVQFRFDAQVREITSAGVVLDTQTIFADRIILAAGLGTSELKAADIRPVLGQAIQLQLPKASPAFQPVITGRDIHLVPLGNSEYWLGATVEFAAAPPVPQAADLEALWQQAIELFPGLSQATILRKWSGLRPRPFGRPAPIIEPLPDRPNVLLASGHYRNGVLLAPATAEQVRQWVCEPLKN